MIVTDRRRQTDGFAIASHHSSLPPLTHTELTIHRGNSGPAQCWTAV